MEDPAEKSLFICSMETYMTDPYFFCNYSVQAINMTEVLSISPSPIIISFSKSKSGSQSKPTKAMSEDENHTLREIVSLRTDDSVPCRMGFGVFGSQVVLAGGRKHPRRLCSSKLYLLDTSLTSFVKAAKKDEVKNRARARTRVFSNIPRFQSPKGLPKLMEIQGKLYALDLQTRLVHHNGPYYLFEVFDPQTESWASLPHPPEPLMEAASIDELSCVVIGTIIVVCGFQSKAYFFDVAEPDSEWKRIKCFYESLRTPWIVKHRKLPFWDACELGLEEDNCKLVISNINDDVQFFHINFSSNGLFIQHVATIWVRTPFEAHTAHFTHLGGHKVCCVLLDAWDLRFKTLGVIFTFEISFSKSATSVTTPSSDDPYFRTRYLSSSTGTSFSVKTLGWRPFEYHWPTDHVHPSLVNVLGLAVCNPREWASCGACGSWFPDTERLNRHFFVSESCVRKQRLVQCKFCSQIFPKEKLSAHFNTSVSCNSKFAGSI